MKKQQKNQRDKHWHGRIYYNPDDPRVFVQKRPGLSAGVRKTVKSDLWLRS